MTKLDIDNLGNFPDKSINDLPLLVPGEDFIYEYSDLTLFYTRAKVLTGKYKGLIVEFGSSKYILSTDSSVFDFDYTLYVAPDVFPENTSDQEFKEFLATMLIEINKDRNHDPMGKEKLDNMLMSNSSTTIKIPKKFYK